ncbi:glycosyltransferase 87 family protein [Allokutzneria albata]|uniref:Alpha-1,2-mannosyltransferase n=1 Tax=Allokutzneria albata TaxID=211114 RepID=A0A1G9X4N8_ALLAB|nr:glycosyltransferase 87 family protein [Allokutzneria albata]SDM91313.1 alpha-1,2-mannosyltransferase [Allokutzneria albata]
MLTTIWDRFRTLVLRNGASLVVAAVVALVAVVLFRLADARHVYEDLDVYRAAVQTWWAGGDMYGLLPKTAAGNHLPFIYPPFAVLVLGPLALLPRDPAVALNFGVSVLALAATLYVVVRRLWRSGEAKGAFVVTSVLLPFALLLEPVTETLDYGQVNLWLMALVAVDCLALSPRWPRGTLVGIAAAIKLTPAVFLLYFLLRKDFRAALTVVISGAAATLVGFVIAPNSSLHYWLEGGASSMSGTPFSANQTITAMLVRLQPPVVVIGVLIVLLSLLAIGMGVVIIRRADAPIAVMATAIVGLLISPTSWSHHWVWIAPTLVIMIASALRVNSYVWLAVAAVTTVVFYVGWHFKLPTAGNQELLWTPGQHLLGNSFVIIGFCLLAAGSYLAWRRPRLLLARRDAAFLP